MRKSRIALCKCAVIFGFAVLFLAANWRGNIFHGEAQIRRDELPVEQTRKNIQVLKGLPEAQLFLVMNSVADSLNVQCDYCHVNVGNDPHNWVWESDAKHEKIVARGMMKMVMDINKASFGGNSVVTCYSCHRGTIEVKSVPPLRDDKGEGKNGSAALPTAEQILNKYIMAVGGQNAASKFKTVVLKGSVQRSERSGAFEITLKGSDKYLLKLTTPQGIIKQGINGAVGWVKNGDAVRLLSAEDLAQLKRAAALYDVVKITEKPAQMTVLGTEKIGDHEAYAVVVQVNSNTTRSFFFDTKTGLLLRIKTTTRTMISPLFEQADFADYRDAGGVKLPFTIITSDVAPFDTATRKFSEIKHNTAIDDALFEIPKSPK